MIGNFSTVTKDVVLGNNVKVFHYVNLYGCEIGDDTKIGSYVEVQAGAKIGKRCKISSHTFICDGVTIGDNCFVGHGVMFINDRNPKSVNSEGDLAGSNDWLMEKTSIGDNVSIGTGAIIMCGISIGNNSVVGAGAVVTKDVPNNCTVVGVPARINVRGC